MQRIDSEKMSQLDSGWGRAESLTDSEFRLFRELLYSECGISIGDEKRTFLESRLRRRMDDLGVKTGYEYYCLLKDVRSKAREMPTLIDSLMICETSFFRNPPQFELFEKLVLAEIISRKERVGARMLRVWSAGCSTGQEPYSILMSILERVEEADKWSVRVFASDLSFTALERAQRGEYRPDQVKGIRPEYLARYFKSEGGSYAVTDSLRKRVVFDYHNLKHDNGLRGLDIVFCRNVMIYFDTDEQRRLVNRFIGSLVPGGYLFLGHAESLQGLSNRFMMVHSNKGIAYKLDG